MSGLPIEGYIGLACGVVFLVVLAHALCSAARDADLDSERDFAERRADMLAAEAERFLRARPRTRSRR